MHWNSRIKKIGFVCCCGCLLLAAANIPEQEYIVKAAFLERFTRFIEWPAESHMEDTVKPFIIGVIGKNPFADALDQLASIQRIKNKPVEIRYFANAEGISECHVLFIARPDASALSKILSEAAEKPILTVCDAEPLFGYGIHILIYHTQEKLSFEIDDAALKKSGLKASYMLLMASQKHE